MAAHPRATAGRSSGSTSAARPDPGTKLLMTVQWALTGFGLFCLVGAAVVLMVSTPSAWPF